MKQICSEYISIHRKHYVKCILTKQIDHLIGYRRFGFNHSQVDIAEKLLLTQRYFEILFLLEH